MDDMERQAEEISGEGQPQKAEPCRGPHTSGFIVDEADQDVEVWVLMGNDRPAGACLTGIEDATKWVREQHAKRLKHRTHCGDSRDYDEEPFFSSSDDQVKLFGPGHLCTWAQRYMVKWPAPN